MNPLPLDIAVKASVLLVGAAVTQAVLHRRGSAAARHLVWAIAIASLLVLPIASAALPHWQVMIPVARASTAIAPHTPAAATNRVVPAAESLAAPAVGAPPPSESTPFAWITVGIAVYAAGVVILLVRLGLQRFALRRLARASRTVTDPEWRHHAERAARDLHLGPAVCLLQSTGEVMPMTFGMRQSTVILPGSAGAWPENRRRAVLLHELAHVARHDCLTQTLAAIACAVYWPHPGVWWAARRLRVERELACDDRVLAAGTEAREYAGHLLEIAHALGATPAPAIALGMARARQLENRLLAVMDTARSRATVQRRGRVLAIAASVAAVLPMATLRAAVVPLDRPGVPGVASGPVSPASTPWVGRSAAQGFTGTWEIRLAPDAGSVHLTMRTVHWSNGTTLPLARLDGLTAAQISGTGDPVHFTSRRDGGTFTFDGICRGGMCGGTYTFEPTPAFAVDLAKRGIGTPTPQEQYELALQDVGLAFLDELSAEGYRKPDVPGLVRAAEHGVGLNYVRSMAALGYRLGTVDALVLLRDHGVDPEFVRGMAANGFARLSPDELVRARDHGVDPPFARDLAALGYRGLALEGLIGARDHGVNPEYVRGMLELGYRLTLADLIQARDHGVDPEYVRGLASLGYTGLSRDALVGARDHGVDPEYVRGLAALGYKDVPLDALIRMRDHGVDPEFVRRLQQRGLGHLSVDQLIERRDRGSDDPDAAARAAVASVQSLWRSIVAWLRG